MDEHALEATTQPPEPQPVKPLVLTWQNNAERMKEISDKLEAGSCFGNVSIKRASRHTFSPYNFLRLKIPKAGGHQNQDVIVYQ